MGHDYYTRIRFAQCENPDISQADAVKILHEAAKSIYEIKDY